MSREHQQHYLRPGTLARLAGVSTDTLRHYERKGLLKKPRRSSNRYREYPPASVARVHLIRRALDMGFTLDELSGIFNVRDRGGVPCRQVRALAGEKLDVLEARIEELIQLRDELRSVLRNWDVLLAKTGSSEPAHLLESLVASTAPRRTHLSPFSSARANRTKKNKESQH